MICPKNAPIDLSSHLSVFKVNEWEKEWLPDIMEKTKQEHNSFAFAFGQ